jgi:hypothetical protein
MADGIIVTSLLEDSGPKTIALDPAINHGPRALAGIIDAPYGLTANSLAV